MSDVDLGMTEGHFLHDLLAHLCLAPPELCRVVLELRELQPEGRALVLRALAVQGQRAQGLLHQGHLGEKEERRDKFGIEMGGLSTSMLIACLSMIMRGRIQGQRLGSGF